MKTDAFIRRAEREDLDVIVEWVEDPDFTQFLYGDPARSPKQVREHIVGMLGRSVGQTMPAAVYLIADSKEHGPFGLISLQHISWRNRCCNIDVYIGKKDLRMTIGNSFALFRALEYCFYELNMYRVNAYIYAFNTKSWRFFAMTGAKRELVLRDHVPRDGKLYDLYGYGLLRPEWDRFYERITNQVKGGSLSAMIEALREEEAAEAETGP